MTTAAPPLTAGDRTGEHPTPEVATIRILIADESSVVTDNIARRLALESDLTVCGTVRDGEAAVQEALQSHPDIAIIDASLPGLDGGQTTEMLTQYVPGTGVIMISMEAENDAYRLAMVAGAREFLQKPFKGDDLVAAVRRVHAFEMRKSTVVPPAPRLQPAAPVDEPAAPSPSARATVTCVTSGKGGVGKTVLAANLAVALAESHPRRVVLIDASLQFGDVAAVLNLKTDRTVTDLVSGGATVDTELLRETLVTTTGDLRVLLAPNSPELAEYVTPAHLRAIVEALRPLADHIVIDTAASMSDVTVTALEVADTIVQVTDLSVPGIKNARLVRGVLEALKIDDERVITVGNHREPSGELDRAGAEGFLGTALSLEVPYEPRFVSTSVAEGVPFVTANAALPASRAVRELVALVDPSLQSGSGAVSQSADGGKKARSRRRLGRRG